MAIISLYAKPYFYSGVADFSQASFWVAAAAICFNPLYWNIVAQNEYRRKTITKLLGNRPYYGCYLLGASIFLLGVLRDHLYNQALASQPVNATLLHPAVKYLGAASFIAGQVFVLTSMYALGVTGTYLGDYFGILMDSMVTGFPFNVIPDPMYWGSSLCFAGVALWYGKPAGLILTALVVVVYVIALRFEGPFTADIYAKAEAAKKKKSRRSSSTTATKRSGSVSRRTSTSKKAAASESGGASSDSPSSAKKTSTTTRRKKSDAAGSSTPSKAASSDAESATPAKRGRKKKVAAA